jgi:hypothetical protein
MHIVDKLLLPLFGAALLAACGGGSGSSASMPPSLSTARGTLLQDPPQLMSNLSAPSLLLNLSGGSNQQLQQLLSLVGSPVCDIATYHIAYEPVGGTNEATTASGALIVPTGGNSNCSGPRPIVLYAHGTTTSRGYNIADLTNAKNAEGLLLAAVFASHGYIVVAPNYAGYDTSTLPYDAFLVANQQSADMIDALTAARSALPVAGAPATTDDGKLFITGYSQGGDGARGSADSRAAPCCLT